MICPVCKKDMVIIEYRDIELDYCTNCKGVWFDSGELELLLETAGVTECQPCLEAMQARPDAITEETVRKCPICLKKMKKTAIREGGNVIVDVCRNNDGIWFDHREIEHLAEAIHGQDTGGENTCQPVMEYLQEVFRY